MNRIRMIGETLLPSVAYGDAAGLPTETMSASDIKKRYDYIDRLIPPTDNPFYTGSFPAGTTSDDTQLSVAVAEALMSDDGFDLGGQATEHLRIFHASPRTISGRIRGWGGSTTSSMERLETGISPHESGQPNGAGNGILMKMAPLVYWQVARDIDYDERARQYDELTTMTHDSDVTRACTRVHGDILSEIMTKPGMTMDDFRFTALGILQEDLDADPKGRIERALRYPTRSFDQLVTRYVTGQKNGHYGFFVSNTLAMAYDVFVVADGDYEKAVYLAVNLGGDTDSIASIAGAMCAAWSGGEFNRPADFESVTGSEHIKRLSVELARAALKLS